MQDCIKYGRMHDCIKYRSMQDDIVYGRMYDCIEYRRMQIDVCDYAVVRAWYVCLFVRSTRHGFV